VEINVRGIVNYIDFFIINRGLDEILLGMPFTIKVQLIYKYPKDRTITTVFKNSDRSK
jgi:hypothetical protein